MCCLIASEEVEEARNIHSLKEELERRECLVRRLVEWDSSCTDLIPRAPEHRLLFGKASFRGVCWLNEEKNGRSNEEYAYLEHRGAAVVSIWRSFESSACPISVRTPKNRERFAKYTRLNLSPSERTGCESARYT